MWKGSANTSMPKRKEKNASSGEQQQHQQREQRQRPNIVFVITDDQGYGDLGHTGNKIIQTPNLDNFAEHKSIRLTEYHVGTTCAPTRSGIMTGLNCNSVGVWHTVGGGSLLRSDVKTLPQVLGDEGYITGLFGKWHLGDEYPFRPIDRGFHHAVYHKGGGLTQISDHWGNNYIDDTYIVNDKEKKFKGYCTDVFFNEAMEFITNNRNENRFDDEQQKQKQEKPPFFAFIATNAPHEPLNVEEKYVNIYQNEESLNEKRRRYYGMITNIDENFIKLQNFLHDQNLENDTILIFTTDNGTASGVELDKNQFVISGYNAGMRGKKGSPYEGGHRVPFFISYPAGGFDGGKDISLLTSYIDVMPTLLDLCQIPISSWPKMEGKSWHPLFFASAVEKGDIMSNKSAILKGSKEEEEEEQTKNDDNDDEDGWQLVPTYKEEIEMFEKRTLVVDTQRIPYPLKWRNSAVMKGSYRLIYGRDLYDLSNDPGQRNNISKDKPNIVSMLRSDYEHWWDTCCNRQICHINMSHIGSTKCPVVKLTTMNLRNEDGDVVFYQGQVRNAQTCFGWWELYAEKDATYIFKMRRWPRETNYKIGDGINGFDVDIGPTSNFIDPTQVDAYRNGKKIHVYGAAMKIDETENYYLDLKEDDKEATFQVQLIKGRHQLRAWFSGGAIITSPYYVSIAAL